MSRLELRQEESGPRYYLQGQGIHAGDLLELRVYDGPAAETAREKWIRGRYEWSYARADRPTFHTDLGCWQPVTEWDRKNNDVQAATVDVVIPIPPWAELRWPVRRSAP